MAQGPVLSVVDYTSWEKGYMPPSEHILIDQLSYRGAKVVLSSDFGDQAYWLVVRGERIYGRGLLRIRRAIESILDALEEDEVSDAFLCETCGKQIKSGDKYTTTLDDCYLCAEHAPSFQDCASHWADRETLDDEEREVAEGCKAALAEHVAAGGSAEDKPLTVME